MVLGGWLPGKVGSCWNLYSSIAQLAERMTVNHDVAGSSPAGGAKIFDRRTVSNWFVYFFYKFSLDKDKFVVYNHIKL